MAKDPEATEFPAGPEVRKETHFGGRVLTCYSQRPRSLDHMLRDAVRCNAGGDAVIDGEIRLSYGDLNDLVDRIGTNLTASGIGVGDRVALATGNRAEFISVLMAVIRIGAIAVPINCREQTPGFAHILNHSGAKAIVFDTMAGDRLPARKETPEILHRFALGQIASGDRLFADLLEDRKAILEPASPDEEDVAVILYTSGTTGRPKGVMLTHFNIAHSVMHFETCMALNAGDRSLLAVPASHVTGLIANILTMVRVAGCTLVLPHFTAEGFLELAARERMTHSVLVPAMYNLCQLRADFFDYDLSDWRIGGYGGAPMPEATIAALAQKLPDLILVNAYGATETASPATIMPMGGTRLHADSVGKTVPCGTIRIVGDDGNDVALGEAGEIWIAGPMVTPGYWRDEAITNTSVASGYWKSGDIGTKDRDGFIRLHDRKKDMIIRGGYNIYSAEVENCLNHHPDVVECAAVAQPDPVLGEKLHVFVFAPSSDLSVDDVRSFCAASLADYKIPDFVTFLNEALPRNANGKIMKADLREIAGG